MKITKHKRVVTRVVPARPKSKKVEWPDFEARRKKIFPKGIKGAPVSKILDEAGGEY